jgi:TonB family protein
MTARFTKLIFVVTLFLAGLTGTTRAQEGSWQKIGPVGESFTVLMPTKAVEASRRIPLNDKDSVRERVYYSLAGDKRYMVVSFFKTAPDRLPGLSSFDEFLRSIEQTFKSGERDVKKSLVFDRVVPLNGREVRQYHIKLGEYSGVAHFAGSDRAFYGLIVIGADENDSDANRFLSSFALSEANADPQSSGVILDTPTNAAELERIRTALPPEPWPATAAPISGGVLNGKAVRLPTPEYPEAAHNTGDSGTVAVQITIDEQGNVIWAEAAEGPASLRGAAVAAAWKARFTPTKLSGQPVKVTGRVLYNFVGR